MAVKVAVDRCLTLSRPGFFGAPVAREGVILPPFENRVPLVLTPYCLLFWKACPKLDHMTHFGFYGNHFKCLRLLKGIFLQKPQTKGPVQMVIVLVFNESANTKKALDIYLRLTLNGNYVGWAKVRVLREYSIARGYHRSRQSRCWSNN